MIFFAYKNPFIKYEKINTSEDKMVKQFAYKYLKVNIYDNDPKIYIRTIHENTSVYVNTKKRTIKDTSTNINFFENKPTQNQINYVNQIVTLYYKNI